MAPLRRSAAALPLLLAGALGGPLNLTVLHTNDHHSHLAAEKLKVPAASAGLAEDAEVPLGGFPLAVAAYRELARAAEAKGGAVLRLHAGDALTGTSYYSRFRGAADAEMMAHICFDAFALGNHEFDDGDASLAAFVDALRGNASLCNSTRVLAANVVPGASSPLHGRIQPSATVTVGGERVGIVGIDVKLKTMASSSPSHGTVLTDERVAAQAEVDRLLANGVDKIVLLTHIGYEADKAWMAGLRGVDVVVGGDSHSLLGGADLAAVGLRTAGPYPTELTNGDGKRVCVATAWEYSKAVGSLEVEFDGQGDVLSCGGGPRLPYDASRAHGASGAALSAADGAALRALLGAPGGSFLAVAEDPAARAALEAYTAQLSVRGQEAIADVPRTLCYDRFPGQGRGQLCTRADTQQHGGAACQLVAKAFLAVVKSGDIAVQNAGGCRSDIAAGRYTYEDAHTMLPFSNTLVTLQLTGAQVHEVLEAALDYGLSPDGSTGAYPYAAGLRFDVNANLTRGQRVSRIEVNSRLEHAWAPIDGARNYTLVTNSYVAGGKDGYVPLLSAAASLVDTYTEYSEGLVSYARAVQTLVEPAPEEFSTQAYTDSAGVVHSVRALDLGSNPVSGALSSRRGATSAVALAVAAAVAMGRELRA